MDAIVSLAKRVPSFLPRRELASLDLNVEYHILNIRKITTRFGPSVVVDLEERGTCPQTTDKTFFVYLPKRWAEIYTTEQLEKVEPCKLSLTVLSHTVLSNERVSVQLSIAYVSHFSLNT